MMIFIACLLTVLIETPFMALFGYHKKDDIVVIVCTNIITNLLLNLSLALLFTEIGTGIFLLEALVVLAEFAIYSLAFRPSAALFFLTAAANILSYGLGTFIFS